MSGESSPPWTVCLVTDVYPPDCGGSGWSTHALARVLRKQGHCVSVVMVDPASHGISTRHYDDVRVTCVGVAAARRSVRARLGARDYAHDTLATVLDEMCRHDATIDILHAQHLHSGPPSIAAGRAHGRATVVTVRDYWPVCLHGTSWWGRRVCDGCSTANLTDCMSEYWRWPRPLSRAMVPWARRRLTSRATFLGASDIVLTVSDAVKRRIRDHLPGAEVSTVPNIVDVQDVEEAAATDTQDVLDTPYMLAAGKLQPTKGFDLLLSALTRVPGSAMKTAPAVPLIIAGDGPSRSRLEEQASKMEAPVRFLGWVGHERLLSLQSRAQAVLLPSAWHEPLSRVVLETMALGTPVVAWDRGGSREIIDSGVNGWLVRETEELAEALAALASPAHRRRVGEAGRARVLERFSPKAVYPQMLAAYSAALARAGRAAGG